MTTVDAIILACLALGLAHGLFTGFIRQATDLLGIVVGIVLAIRLMNPLGEELRQLLGGSEVAMRIAALVLVIIAVQLVAYVLARVLERIVGFVRLSFVNRTAGGVFGVFKTGLLLSVALIVLARFDVPGEETRETSVLYQHVTAIVPTSWNLLTDHIPEIGLEDMVNGRGEEAER